MTDQIEEVRVYYLGKNWDAPITDGAIEVDERLASSFLQGTIPCDLCQEVLVEGENILIMPNIGGHTECIIRSIMGDVAHLEGRCTCNGPGSPEPGEDAQTYRESSLAAVQWLVDHGQGRFRA